MTESEESEGGASTSSLLVIINKSLADSEVHRLLLAQKHKIKGVLQSCYIQNLTTFTTLSLPSLPHLLSLSVNWHPTAHMYFPALLCCLHDPPSCRHSGQLATKGTLLCGPNPSGETGQVQRATSQVLRHSHRPNAGFKRTEGDVTSTATVHATCPGIYPGTQRQRVCGLHEQYRQGHQQGNGLSHSGENGARPQTATLGRGRANYHSAVWCQQTCRDRAAGWVWESGWGGQSFV